MLDVDRVQDVFREVKLRKFKNEYCSVCHQEDDCVKKSEIKICMQLDGYELALKMYDDVDCTREEFEQVMMELEKEKILEKQAEKVREAMR